MRFMLMMIPNVPEGEWEPDAEAVAAMTRFNEELVQAGAMLAGDGFHPPETGVRVAFGGGEPRVVDIPSPAVGGYWIVDVASQEEAIDWVRRCPASDGDQIEIRRIFELEDFPQDVQDAAQLSQEPPEQTKARG